MQQLSIFDVFEDFQREDKIPEVIERFVSQKLSWSRHERKLIDPAKIVAVYIPTEPAGKATPCVATFEDGHYFHFEILHGHIVERTMPLNFNWKPGYFWTWLKS